MGTTPTSSYEHAEVQDYMDQHLDMETAILRVELEEAEAAEKCTPPQVEHEPDGIDVE